MRIGRYLGCHINGSIFCINSFPTSYSLCPAYRFHFLYRLRLHGDICLELVVHTSSPKKGHPRTGFCQPRVLGRDGARYNQADEL